MLQILAPNEAVVAIGIEIRIGEVAGMMNLAIPSIIIKMLRQKFDQQWSVRKSESTEEDRERMLRLLKRGTINMDARIQGMTLQASDLMDLEQGDVVMLDYQLGRPIDLVVNGNVKFQGRVATNGQKRVFCIEEILELD